MEKLTSEIRYQIKFGGLLTQSALLQRGWTRKQIADYLPEPRLFKNPKYSSGSPMKVWDADSVSDIENEIRSGWYQG